MMISIFRTIALLTVIACAVGAQDKQPGPRIAASFDPVKQPEFLNSEHTHAPATLHSNGKTCGTKLQLCGEGPWAGEVACILPSAEWLQIAAKGEHVEQAGEARPSEEGKRFRLADEEDKYLRLFDGDQQVLTYNYGMILKKGVPEHRRRSSYIHPIYGLDGELLSDDFPRDHYHHRGLMWVWPHMTVEGHKEASLWDIRGIRQEFNKFLGKEVGPVCAVFGVKNSWMIGDEKVATEVVWVRAFKAGPKGRAIDVQLSWTADDKPIRIRGQKSAGKGYGGFCYRPMSKKGVVISAGGEVLKKDSLHKRFPWADFSAKYGGRYDRSGLAVFIHPDNPGYPNEWITRHYRFLGCSWPGTETVTFEPGKTVTLRYRLWLHRGDAEQGAVEQTFEAYRAMSR